MPPLINFLAKSPLVDKYDLSSITSLFSGGASLAAKVAQLAAERLKVDLVYQGNFQNLLIHLIILIIGSS